jgi:hypothetical protein
MLDAHNSYNLHLPPNHNRTKIDLPLNVGVTPLLLLKLETNNKLNTIIELQIMVGEHGAWSMVKLAKFKGSSQSFGKSKT